ncbi:MAG: hypothetical protein ACOYD0_09505 [Candidatus Nanopelagicales bacterium]
MVDNLGAPAADGSVIPGQRCPTPHADSTADGDQRKAEWQGRTVKVDLSGVELDVDLSHLTLSQLRERRSKLAELEGQISYWRRIIQARLDLLRDGSLRRGATVEGLQRVLSKHLDSNSRKVLLATYGRDSQPVQLIGLGDLWSRGITTSADQNLELESDLVAAEGALSECRGSLHANLDAATAELIGRYHQDPAQAFSALPTRSARPTPL